MLTVEKADCILWPWLLSLCFFANLTIRSVLCLIKQATAVASRFFVIHRILKQISYILLIIVQSSTLLESRYFSLTVFTWRTVWLYWVIAEYAKHFQKSTWIYTVQFSLLHLQIFNKLICICILRLRNFTNVYNSSTTDKALGKIFSRLYKTMH